MDHDHVLIATFPHPLARLVLCGGEGLPAAWGPVVRASDGVWTWNPLTQRAIRPATIEQPALLSEPDGWTLPLGHWRPRLAVVAAWMLGWHKVIAADVQADRGGVVLRGWSHTSDAIWVRRWGPTGIASPAGRDLYTLPAHLRDHDPAVALLPSLFDVPEIRARMEALHA